MINILNELNMTPKEKAKELVDNYFNNLPILFEVAKECALIAVKEVLNSIDRNHDYWEQVEIEINKI